MKVIAVPSYSVPIPEVLDKMRSPSTFLVNPPYLTDFMRPKI